MKGFAFPRKNAGEAADLAATLEANNRELVAWLNSATVRFDTDGTTVTLPGDLVVEGSGTVDGSLAVTGALTKGGTAVSLSGHTHTQPAFVGVLAYPSSSTSIPSSTDTVVAFNEERFDSSGFHSNSVNNTRLTVPSGYGGYYAIGGKLAIDANSTGVRTGFIRLNGSTKIAESNRNAPTAYGGLWEVNTVYSLSAGDYIELGIWQDSGVSLNTLGSGQYEQFWMYRVGT